MLHFCVNKHALFTDAVKKDQIHIITLERSPKFGAQVSSNRVPIAVPKARWVIASYKHRRLSWIAPEEFAAIQQLSFLEFFDGDADALSHLIQSGKYTYSDLIRFPGNAYHMNSCGSFVCLVLLHSRSKNIGDLVLPSM